MQDFQSAPAGLAGRIFFGGSGGGGGGSGGDAGDFRRLRGYPMVGGAPPAAAQQQLPVKCPRCDSTNTKFCYYNNYNLSQPRHFCKSCRRYWTKGGVLRNVPVGGGCRKAKRSSSSSSKSSAKSSASGDKDGHQRQASSSSSASRLSSESSGITTAGQGDASASELPFCDGNLSNSNNPPSISGDPPFNQLVDTTPSSAPETLPEPHPSGSFASFIVPSAAPSASPVPFLGFGFSDLSQIRLPSGQQKTVDEIRVQEQEQEQQQQQQHEGFVVDHTIAGELRPAAGMGGGASGLAALDWPTSVDPALFDLTSAVDPGAYWNQSHWEDTDASLYLP